MVLVLLHFVHILYSIHRDKELHIPEETLVYGCVGGHVELRVRCGVWIQTLVT